jgi:hypothetical protein
MVAIVLDQSGQARGIPGGLAGRSNNPEATQKPRKNTSEYGS